ncbi:MAG TPA: amidohydrolase, partial [Phenylobacterium sp.]|nr:amidohydrolase [Phenylobacterium sp.]
MRPFPLKSLLLGAASLGWALAGSAAAEITAQDKAALIGAVDKGAPRMAQVAQAIWGYAEVGYQETKSSALLQSEQRKAGFKVEPGVAGMPTAFVASFKTGEGPVIAILAEFDA